MPSGSLMGKFAVAIQSYDAENNGYLTLREGDELVLKHDTADGGEPGLVYEAYCFGQVLQNGQANGESGWFPHQLIRLTEG